MCVCSLTYLFVASALLATGAIGMAGAATAHATETTIYATDSCFISTSDNGCEEMDIGILDSGTYEAHGLLHFDVSGIPENATITSAKLKLYILGDPNEAAIASLLYPAGSPWTTDATWYTSDGTTSWTAPGGDLGSIYGKAVESVDGPWVEWDGMESFVEGWRMYPQYNDGFIITQPFYDGFTLYDTTDSSFPPRLVVTYDT
jgi:hypothetical protein